MLVRIERDPALVEKEIAEAENDLERSRCSLEDGDAKWATIQAYYSMFHAAKALVYLAGYREKSHQCLSIALEALYVDKNKLEPRFCTNFKEAMLLRMEADYGLTYSQNSANRTIKAAEEFLYECIGICDLKSRK